MLLRHVVDLGPGQGADARRVGEDGGRLVGVDVDPDEVLVADDQRRVAHPGDGVADLVHVHALALDEELGAVAPALLRQLQVALRRRRPAARRRRGGRCLRLRLLDRLEEALEDHLEAEAAGVDDARLAQDGELRRRVVGRRLGRLAGGPDDRVDARLGIGRGRLGRLARLPGDGEDRALGRLDDRPVGRVGGLLERVGKLGRRQLRLSLDVLGEAPEDLREDDPGVAPGAHQAAVGGERGDLADLLRLRLADVLHRRLQREQHVGPGVAVRHREDVEAVDLLLVGAEPAEAAQQGALEELAVDDLRLCHGVGVSPRCGLHAPPGRTRSPRRPAHPAGVRPRSGRCSGGSSPRR